MIPHIAEWGYFISLSIQSRLGSFSSSSEWLSQCYVDLFQDLTFPPLAQCTKATIGRGSWTCTKPEGKWNKWPIIQNMVNKRDGRWKASFFSEALQLMSGQKVTVYIPVALVRLKEPSQQQLSLRFHSAFILHCNYSRGLGALWALSGGATPSAASESVLLSPLTVHITHLQETDDGVQPKYFLRLPFRFNSTAKKLFLFLNQC